MNQRRVPPIKLLGARGSLRALGVGLILGPLVGLIQSLVLLAIIADQKLMTGLIVMTLLFGLFFGPLLTIGAAANLAVTGFTRADFQTVGLPRLAWMSAVGCAAGILAGLIGGYVLLKIIVAGDAIMFMTGQIGGIVGALIPGAVAVGKVAKARTSQSAAV